MKFLSLAHAAPLLLMLMLGGCDQSGAPAAIAAHATPVGVTLAAEGSGLPALNVHGVIASRDEARLSFKVGGIIARINVEAGDSIRAGQVLAEIEATEIDAQQTQAHELDLKAARDLERGEKLYADEVLSLEQLQNLRTQRQMTAAQLRTLQFNRRYARIAAPGDGLVLNRLVAAHELVAVGQPVLLVSSGKRGFVLRSAVADRELLSLTMGLPAAISIDAAPGLPLTGKITEISRAADATTGLFPIVITLDATALRLASGMVASARLQPRSDERLVRIPAGALVTGEGSNGKVFVLAGGKAQSRAITVAFIDGDQLALRTGLKAGESVITEGAAYLDDGELVTSVKP